MSIFRSTGNFDKLLDKATSHLLMDPDWVSTLQICDLIRQDDVQPKYALNALKKKLTSPNPYSALYALLVVESIVKNCGSVVHEELTSKVFCDFLHELAKTTPHENVRSKLLELIQAWNFAFRKNPKHGALKDMMAAMKAEGYKFPVLRESDAMFAADTAPEWADGDVCHRCRVQFSLMQRKHHCRACGQVFCSQCTSKTSTLPKYGIEKEVRVCDSCFDEASKPSAASKAALLKQESELPAEYLKSPLAQQNQEPPKKTDAELAEEEEFQLALALSQSEAEVKEKDKYKMNSTISYNVKAESTQTSVSSIQQDDTRASEDWNASYERSTNKFPTRNLEMGTTPTVLSSNCLQPLEDNYKLQESLHLQPSVEIHNIEQEVPYEVQTLRVHSGKIFEEFLKAAEYNFFDNRRIRIEIVLPNGELEVGEDFGGVYRDALSEFWNKFYELCTVGTNLKVPYIRHDFGETEWQSIAKIFVKGFETVQYIPIKLAPVFIESCFEEKVKEDAILENFSQYLSDSEANIVKQSLENFENVDTEELIDFFSQYDGKWNPTKQNIRKLITDIAHIELIQKPTFVIKIFAKIFKTSTLSLFEMKSLIEQIKPTVKNCVSKIEIQSGQEVSTGATRVHKYLEKYIKEATEEKRSAFFRYCTGSDLPIQNLSILFTKTAGDIGRVPVAHKCSCILELPITYGCYLNFRNDFNGILSPNIWAMDII